MGLAYGVVGVRRVLYRDFIHVDLYSLLVLADSMPVEGGTVTAEAATVEYDLVPVDEPGIGPVLGLAPDYPVAMLKPDILQGDFKSFLYCVGYCSHRYRNIDISHFYARIINLLMGHCSQARL